MTLRLINELGITMKQPVLLSFRRMCNVLADRSRLDEERMEKLMSELKDARLIAEDADAKSDEIAKKLQFVEEELEAAEERVKTSEAYASNCRLTVIIFAHYMLHARDIAIV